MIQETKIALLPLDNRPVSYLLPKQIADFSNIELILPERKCLGDLNCGSDLAYLEKWLTDVAVLHATPLVISLDNWVYGGLVQSRKHDFTLDELKTRVDTFTGAFCKTSLHHDIYGFSSIMRIPNYNDSSEEKDYWKEYGKKIFNWSELMHKVGRGIVEDISHEELLENWYQSSKLIPPHILADYKGHRDKNLTVNLLWLEALHENCFEYLVFSCDDSGKYGMNVVEAEYISKQIKNHNFSNLTRIISGTDEVPLVLFTKAVLKKANIQPSVSVYFNSVSGKNQYARYESSTIYSSVINQIDLLGIEKKDFNESDLVLYIHTADSVQGDHVFNIEPENTKKNTRELIKQIEKNDKLFILIDLAYANGADPLLVESLIKSKINWNKCYGYAAWNTCSNSIGSALAIGVNRWVSEKKNEFTEKEFKKCMLVRFLDDYAYQAKIRHSDINEKEVNDSIQPYVKTFSKLLGLNDINVKCKLPWNRSFEIEVEI